jgi:PRO8NT (NUC069), PrP8 N-terminal domain
VVFYFAAERTILSGVKVDDTYGEYPTTCTLSSRIHPLTPVFSTTKMTSIPPPPPPGWSAAPPPPGMAPPPPGYRPPADPQVAKFAQKKKEWLRTQRNRFAEKRKGGFVESQKADMPPEHLRKIVKDIGDVSQKKFRGAILVL